MNTRSLQFRFLFPVCITIIVLVLGGALVFSFSEQRRIFSELDIESTQQRRGVVDTLAVIDTLVTDQTKGSMKVLMARGAELGSPFLGQETVTVRDRTVQQLYLGDTTQANRFELVDTVVELVGGTATLFVKSGDDFVRVSTNVISDGQRAIGTILAPTGRAIAAIRNGDAYYGLVDILGNPFITGYEPMRNFRGETIGIWYVGYRLDMQVLSDAIAQSRLLDNGFLALVDAGGKLRFGPAHLSEEAVVAVLESSDGWKVQRETFGPWGFQVISAYPESEARAIARTRMGVIILSGVIGAGLLIVLMVILLKRLVLRPLGGEPAYAADVMRKVAAGDLAVKVNVPRDSQNSLLAELSAMVGSLRKMVGEIGANAAQLAGSSREISSLSKDVSGATRRQSDATSSIAASVQEMTVSVAEISENASQTRENAASAARLAESGAEKADEAARDMNTMAGTVKQTAEKISLLAKSADDIGGIANVIKEIAAQTNLLALNAAIEAARAGEQGRGFAVVADEVRGLAERTAKATVQIEEMIGGIQGETKESVQFMSRVGQQVEHGAALVNSVTASLRDIREGNNHALERIGQMAHATSEQSVATTTIAQEVEQIARMVEDTSSSMQAAAKAATDLEALSGNLQEMVTRFRY